MKNLGREEFLQKCGEIYDGETERGKVIDMLCVVVKKRQCNGEICGGVFMGRKTPVELSVVKDA